MSRCNCPPPPPLRLYLVTRNPEPYLPPPPPLRLYLVTRNPEPYLPPDARSMIAATNFTVTRSGLEGQLLGLTIQREQPELEAQKSGLLKQEEDLKVCVWGGGRGKGRACWEEGNSCHTDHTPCVVQVALADLEKSLLETLANSTGEGWGFKHAGTGLATQPPTPSALMPPSLNCPPCPPDLPPHRQATCWRTRRRCCISSHESHPLSPT